MPGSQVCKRDRGGHGKLDKSLQGIMAGEQDSASLLCNDQGLTCTDKLTPWCHHCH